MLHTRKNKGVKKLSMI